MNPLLASLRRRAFLAAALLCPLAGLALDLPRPVAPAAPSPAPAFPGGFDVVPAPGVSGFTIPAQAPAVAEFTRSGAPGDTLAVSGWQLSRFAGVEAGRDTRFVVLATQGGTTVEQEADIIHQNGDMAAVRLPATLPAWSTYFLYPVNAAGAGPAVLVNKTELWWTGPVNPAPGEPFHVFGRNLSRGDAEAVAWIYLKPTAATAGAGRWLQAAAAGPLHSAYTLPADLPLGTYEVWAHNTHGGAYGWSGPLPLEVRSRKTFAGATFDVTLFGATPDDTSDNTAAIQAAIDAADNAPGGNATVRIPAGRFLLTRTLFVGWTGVRIQGAGKGVTTLAARENHSDWWLINGMTSGYELRDLTLDCTDQAARLIVDGESRNRYDDAGLQMRDASGARVINVGFVGGYKIVDTHGGRNLWFEGCEFIVSGSNFYGISSDLFFVNCVWKGLRDVNSLNAIWGGRNFAFLGCDAGNLDASRVDGHARGRFLSGSGIWDVPTRNLYVGSLRTREMAPRMAPDNEVNAGEQIMFEDTSPVTREAIASATNTTVVLKSPVPYSRPDLGGLIAVVTAGKGFGQSREISRWDHATNTLTLAEPWVVTPGADSILSIGRSLTRVGIYGCSFEGKTENLLSPDQSASAGVQLDGATQDLIAQKNHFSQLRIGFRFMGPVRFVELNNSTQTESVFNVLVTENRFTSCRVGVNYSCWADETVPQDPAFFGNTVRRNTMTSILDDAVAFTPSISNANLENFFNVFDGNIATETSVGFRFTAVSTRDNVLVGNRFAASGNAFDNVAVDTENPRSAILRENQFTGFGRLYSDTSPAPSPRSRAG